MADTPGFLDRTFDEIVEAVFQHVDGEVDPDPMVKLSAAVMLVVIYGASNYLSVSVFVLTCGFRKKPRSPRELIHILTYKQFRKVNRLTSETSARMLASGGGP